MLFGNLYNFWRWLLTLKFFVLFQQNSVPFDIFKKIIIYKKRKEKKKHILKEVALGSSSCLVGYQPQKVMAPYSMRSMKLYVQASKVFFFF
jgi:hypothetical protein